jgi:FtsH-binding integral membrane protein
MPENIDRNLAWLIAAVALFGGLANALNDGSENKSIGHIVALTIGGGFSGIVFGFLACHYFGEQQYIVTAIAGAGGVLGVKGLKGISEKVKS